jgi:hypothetical protein
LSNRAAIHHRLQAVRPDCARPPPYRSVRNRGRQVNVFSPRPKIPAIIAESAIGLPLLYTKNQSW